MNRSAPLIARFARVCTPHRARLPLVPAPACTRQSEALGGGASCKKFLALRFQQQFSQQRFHQSSGISLVPIPFVTAPLLSGTLLPRAYYSISASPSLASTTPGAKAPTLTAEDLAAAVFRTSPATPAPATESPVEDDADDDVALAKKPLHQRLVLFLRKYGPIAVGVHFVIWLATLSAFYVAVRNGVAIGPLLSKLPFISNWFQEDSVVEWVTGTKGALTVAFVATKALEPLRIPLTFFVVRRVFKRRTALDLAPAVKQGGAVTEKSQRSQDYSQRQNQQQQQSQEPRQHRIKQQSWRRQRQWLQQQQQQQRQQQQQW